MIIVRYALPIVGLIAVPLFFKRGGMELLKNCERKYYGLGLICLVITLLFGVDCIGTLTVPMANGGLTRTTAPLTARGLASLGVSIAGAACILASLLAGVKKEGVDSNTPPAGGTTAVRGAQEVEG